MTPLEGGGQYCAGCQPSQPVIPRGAMSTVTSMPTCPKCGRGLDSGTLFCDCTIRGRENFEYGGFLIRLAAYLIDAVILFIVGFIAGLVITDLLELFIFGTFVTALYHVGFLASEGATPGKMAMNLRVVNLDGTPIGLGQAIVRVFVAGILGGIAYIVMIFNEEKRGIHDYLANTIVVVQRK